MSAGDLALGWQMDAVNVLEPVNLNLNLDLDLDFPFPHFDPPNHNHNHTFNTNTFNCRRAVKLEHPGALHPGQIDPDIRAENAASNAWIRALDPAAAATNFYTTDKKLALGADYDRDFGGGVSEKAGTKFGGFEAGDSLGFGFKLETESEHDLDALEESIELGDAMNTAGAGSGFLGMGMGMGMRFNSFTNLNSFNSFSLNNLSNLSNVSGFNQPSSTNNQHGQGNAAQNGGGNSLSGLNWLQFPPNYGNLAQSAPSAPNRGYNLHANSAQGQIEGDNRARSGVNHSQIGGNSNSEGRNRGEGGAVAHNVGQNGGGNSLEDYLGLFSCQGQAQNAHNTAGNLGNLRSGMPNASNNLGNVSLPRMSRAQRVHSQSNGSHMSHMSRLSSNAASTLNSYGSNFDGLGMAHEHENDHDQEIERENEHDYNELSFETFSYSSDRSHSGSNHSGSGSSDDEDRSNRNSMKRKRTPKGTTIEMDAFCLLPDMDMMDNGQSGGIAAKPGSKRARKQAMAKSTPKFMMDELESAKGTGEFTTAELMITLFFAYKYFVQTNTYSKIRSCMNFTRSRASIRRKIEKIVGQEIGMNGGLLLNEDVRRKCREVILRRFWKLVEEHEGSVVRKEQTFANAMRSHAHNENIPYVS